LEDRWEEKVNLILNEWGLKVWTGFDLEY